MLFHLEKNLTRHFRMNPNPKPHKDPIRNATPFKTKNAKMRDPTPWETQSNAFLLGLYITVALPDVKQKY
jgi:hypothetical protein